MAKMKHVAQNHGMFEQGPLSAPPVARPGARLFSGGGWLARRRTQDVSRKVEAFCAALRRERSLACRLHYRFCFLTLQDTDACHDGSGIDALVPVFQSRLRETDVVGLLSPDTLGVILPQTTVAQAHRLVCEICRASGDLCTRRRCQISEYPLEDASNPSGRSGGEGLSFPGAVIPETATAVHSVDEILSGRVPLWKRVLDVSLASVALLVLSPLMTCVALTIKVVSPGPVLFRQQRIGHLGRNFACLKFRSMRVDSDPALHAQHVRELICDGQRQLQKLDARHDPRLIPMGRIFRAAGLDELPQLINVLRGEMSLVGPRPCVAYEYRHFKDWQKRRCETPPGLTGFWQVNGKNRTTFEQMMRLDLAYGRQRTLYQDVVSLLRTPAVVLQQVFELARQTRIDARAPVDTWVNE